MSDKTLDEISVQLRTWTDELVATTDRTKTLGLLVVARNEAYKVGREAALSEARDEGRRTGIAEAKAWIEGLRFQTGYINGQHPSAVQQQTLNAVLERLDALIGGSGDGPDCDCAEHGEGGSPEFGLCADCEDKAVKGGHSPSAVTKNEGGKHDG